MASPYFLMVLLYLLLAGLAVLENSLAHWGVLLPLPNLRWLTIHLVVLGALVEFFFGALPLISAARFHHPKPKFHWETWLLLNGGLAILVLGMLVMNFPFITAGGTAIFLAVLQLARQLAKLRPGLRPSGEGLASGVVRKLPGSGSLKFYLAGLGYLLVGVLVGTGLWQGWAGPLRIAIPKEVHVHSNLWGFTALVFAGLLIDASPRLTGRELAGPKRTSAIFWLMSLGALGLVLGPWLDINLLQVAGLAAHTVGSILLIGGFFWPIRRAWKRWQPSLWQIGMSYVWFFLPVVVAPLVVVRVGVGTEVAGSGGPLLIFGWILQFCFAVIPSFLRSPAQPASPLHSRGSWASLAAANTASLIYWISLFTPAYQSALRGTAFFLWLIAMLPLIGQLVSTFKGLEHVVGMESSDLSHVVSTPEGVESR